MFGIECTCLHKCVGYKINLQLGRGISVVFFYALSYVSAFTAADRH